MTEFQVLVHDKELPVQECGICTKVPPIPIERMYVKLSGVQDVELVGVYLQFDENSRYYSCPQRNTNKSNTLNFTLDRTGWRTAMKQLLFEHNTPLPEPTKEFEVGLYYCSLKCELVMEMVIYGPLGKSEQKISKYNIPLASRLVPGQTKCNNDEFFGHTLNGTTIWKSYNEETNQETTSKKKALVPSADITDMASCSTFEVPIGANGIVHKLNSSGRWSDDDAIHTEVSQAFATLIDCLKQTTIRGHSLLELFWVLADRNGIIYPLAVVGGAVRDTLCKTEPDDIDIVVAGNYKELEDHLRDFFVGKGESVGKNTLFTKPKSKQYGQLKIMKTEV